MMSNETNTPLKSGSINVWLRSSLLSRMTDFMLLGGKKAVLSWDIDKKTLTLNEVGNGDATINTIFAAMASQVTAAYFPPGKNFLITVNGTEYNLSLRNTYANSALVTDAIELIDDDGVEGRYSESKSILHDFKVFLKKESPSNVYISPLGSRTTIKTTIGVVAILIALILIGFIIGFISKS